MKDLHLFRVGHIFCGSGGGAIGFEQTKLEYRGIAGRFVTVAGIDSDPEACQDFEALTYGQAHKMDLFSYNDYTLFHGSVVDPRLGCCCRNGSYGVQDYDAPAKTVTGADIHSSSAAVADKWLPDMSSRLDPPPIIIAPDGTWHRPLTTYELAMLQGLPTHMRDGSPLQLAGESDARWRERIGNMVPPPAAKAIAEVDLKAKIMSIFNAWELSHSKIWVVPFSIRPDGRIERRV